VKQCVASEAGSDSFIRIGKIKCPIILNVVNAVSNVECRHSEFGYETLKKIDHSEDRGVLLLLIKEK
jgi:hypothetical protein